LWHWHLVPHHSAVVQGGLVAETSRRIVGKAEKGKKLIKNVIDILTTSITIISTRNAGVETNSITLIIIIIVIRITALIMIIISV
jgi:hypothetical protein